MVPGLNVETLLKISKRPKCMCMNYLALPCLFGLNGKCYLHRSRGWVQNCPIWTLGSKVLPCTTITTLPLPLQLPRLLLNSFYHKSERKKKTFLYVSSGRSWWWWEFHMTWRHNEAFSLTTLYATHASNPQLCLITSPESHPFLALLFHHTKGKSSQLKKEEEEKMMLYVQNHLVPIYHLSFTLLYIQIKNSTANPCLVCQ